MQCPHCFHSIAPQRYETLLHSLNGENWYTSTFICPNIDCRKVVIYLLRTHIKEKANLLPKVSGILETILIYPKDNNKKKIPSDSIPEEIYSDYSEAVEVLSISPKASAALSRRCLQNLIENHVNIKDRTLDAEITKLINGGGLPSFILESLDAIRVIGNFAAHPNKSITSGEIVEVELGEAEWTISVLESLFDFYFIQPVILDRKKKELNKKLADFGKRELK